MSVLDSPTELGDDLDGLLQAFFRSRMPHPWPAPPTPRPSESPKRPSRRTLSRGRYALAASVALLLLGSLLLPSRAPDGKSFPLPEGTNIGSRDMQKRMEREHKLRQDENKNKIGFADDGDNLGLLDSRSVK